MVEGWINDDYLILYSEEKAAERARQYALQDYIPGFDLVGLKGWDDFIVRDGTGNVFTVPTLPLLSAHMEPYSLHVSKPLVPDERFQGKFKWYVKPVIFGGDPSPGQNVVWLNQSEHCQAVVWWNNLYKSVARGANA